ncbi:MAG: OB-fold nucleic acid binding domain-containing protein, partial [Parvibaculum sp.]
MRPEILYPLFAPARSLPGIGPRLEKLVERLAGPKVIDLLWHLPSGLIDRRSRPKIAGAKDGEIATIEVSVGLHVPPRTKRLPYRVHVSDETGEMQLVFFNARPDYLAKLLPEGSRRIVSGRIEFYQGAPQMTHPDHIVGLDESAALPLLEPVYPLTAGLPLKSVQKALQAALPLLPDLPEWQNGPWLKANGWPAWRAALQAAHEPKSAADIAPDAPARARLAYDELLANQLALGLVRLRMKKLPGRSIAGDGRLRRKVEDALPFALTGAQARSLAEIDA